MRHGIEASLRVVHVAVIRIARQGRSRCASCGRRRVLFAVLADTDEINATVPACRECWGMTE